MSAIFHGIQKIDPLGTFFAKKDPILRNVNSELGLIRNPTLPPPGPPNQDVAANAAQQQQDILRRRRGVMSNIYAGGSAGPPDVASKSALGN